MLPDGVIDVCWVLYRPKSHPREGFLPEDLEHGDAWEQKRGLHHSGLLSHSGFQHQN